MLILGIDLGTSFLKVCIYDADSVKVVTSIQYPNTEVQIISKRPGWAEQPPETWWENTTCAIKKAHETKLYHPKDIRAIGISYQMHGLVLEILRIPEIFFMHILGKWILLQEPF